MGWPSPNSLLPLPPPYPPSLRMKTRWKAPKTATKAATKATKVKKAKKAKKKKTRALLYRATYMLLRAAPTLTRGSLPTWRRAIRCYEKVTWQARARLHLHDDATDVLDIHLVHPSSIDDVLDFYDSNEDDAADPYWAVPWPSAFALAEFIAQNVHTVKNKRVFDAGCGLGLVGLAALRSGAKCAVLADREPLAVRCAELSASACGFAVHADTSADGACAEAFGSEGATPIKDDAGHAGVAVGAVFSWDTPADFERAIERADGRCDVLLCADVLYEAKQAKPVAEMASRLLVPGGELLLADPPNRAPQNRRECLKLMHATSEFHTVDSLALSTRDVSEEGRWGERKADRDEVPILLERLVWRP